MCSWNDDILQHLKILFVTAIDGTYKSVGNPDEVVEQIGWIFDEYIRNHGKENLSGLRDSVIYDDSVVSPLLEYHLIYGNTANNDRLDDSCKLLQRAKASKLDCSSSVSSDTKFINVEGEFVNI